MGSKEKETGKYKNAKEKERNLKMNALKKLVEH